MPNGYAVGCSSRMREFMVEQAKGVWECFQILQMESALVTSLSEKHVLFLKLFKVLLNVRSDRLLCAGNSCNTLAFTDACYEKGSTAWSCGIGGVLIRSGFAPQFFSFCLNEQMREALGEKNQKQIIFEAETLAAVVAFVLWKDLLAGQRVFFFVDNEGTKFSLLKGLADNQVVDRLAEAFIVCEVGRNVCFCVA